MIKAAQRRVDVYLHTAHSFVAYKILPRALCGKKVQMGVRVGAQCESPPLPGVSLSILNIYIYYKIIIII